MRRDEEILKDVINELKWDPIVTETHIGVSVSEGTVTLTGAVASFKEKWEAEKAVERVSGVRVIANELEVILPDESKRDDVDLARAISEVLTWNLSVPESVKAVVENGWVTLKGEVEWGYQRDAAEEAIRSLWGVVGISNEIKVKPKVEPTEIKKKIEEALKRSAAEEAKNIDVKVEGSRVVLKGKVRSLDEYWAARNAAWSAPGVTDVDAELQVAA